MKTLFSIFIVIHLIAFQIKNDLSAQKLTFDISQYDVYPHYYQPYDGDIYDTLHYDSELLLTGDFSMNEYQNNKHFPILKGKFKKGKLIDSVFAYKNEGKLYMRGYCSEQELTDTFTLIGEYSGSLTYRFPGVKSGKFTYYNAWTKEKTRIENYRNGKLDGIASDFENGKEWRRFTYENGISHGKSYWYFYSTDIVEREWEYIHDTLAVYREWHKKDTLEEITIYQKGIIQSKKEYWPNGNIFKSTLFPNVDIRSEYTETEWYDNGQLNYTKVFKNGLQEGNYEEFHPNGKLKIRGFYLNDSLEGKFESWLENGKIEEKGFFKRGYIVKGYKHYDEKGKYIGEWSNYGNRHYWGGYGHEGVIDGIYDKENYVPRFFDYTPTPPSFELNNELTRSERRLLNKYKSIEIELHLANSDQERYTRGYVSQCFIKNEIKGKHRYKIQNIILGHLEITSPFLVGELPVQSVLHGTVKFEKKQ